MANIFQPVERQKAKLRLALTGVSGGGKTLGALYVAYGITGDWSKIALIDTERERGRLYANRSDLPFPTGTFQYAPLYAPYWVSKYKEYVAEAAALVGPDGVVIVDSLTHAWNNEGGVLEYKDQLAAQPGKNSYTAWNEAGKEQNSLINHILSVPCHTIVTMRSKMAYAMELNDKGKQQPVKLGMAPVQREDTEYEFDIVLDIARSHVAMASKDVTFLDKFGAIITPELGEELIAWLSEGKDPEIYHCADCGTRILTDPNATAKQRVEKSTEMFGRALCAGCGKKAYATMKAQQAQGEPATPTAEPEPPQEEALPPPVEPAQKKASKPAGKKGAAENAENSEAQKS